MRTILAATLGALSLISLSAPAMAQTPAMSPLESVCTQYGRQLTTHVAPQAVMGTNEYRRVFFPARDECMSRGGPQFMPNGHASAPHFRPGPVAQPNPPPQTPGNVGNPTPPPAQPVPPVATPRPQPLPTPTPTATPAPTPGQPPTPAQIATMLQRHVPAGMSFPQAVRAAMASCEANAIHHANANPNYTDSQWRDRAFQVARQCASAGGAINGQLTNSTLLARAMIVAMDGSYACEVTEDGTRICINDKGQWFTCWAGGCIPMDEVIWVTNGMGDGMINFFSCAGGSCMRIPINEYPRGGRNGGGIAGRDAPGKKFRDRYMAGCRAAGGHTAVLMCGFSACMKDNNGDANYCKAAMVDGTGKSIDQAFAEHLAETFKPFMDYANSDIQNAIRSMAAQVLQDTAIAWAKELITSDGAKVLDPFGEQMKSMARPLTKAASPSVSPWLKGLGMKTPATALYELWLGISMIAYPSYNPCGTGTLPPEYCGTIMAIVTGPSRNANSRGFDTAYYCQDLYGTKNPLRRTTLPPAFVNPLAAAMVRDCTRAAPHVAQARDALHGINRNCTDSWTMSQTDVHSWSRVVNGCFWRMGYSSPDPAIPTAGRIGAEAFTVSLQKCSEGFGLKWNGGSGVHAHATPKPGQPAPNLPAYANHVRNCITAHINAMN